MVIMLQPTEYQARHPNILPCYQACRPCKGVLASVVHIFQLLFGYYFRALDLAIVIMLQPTEYQARHPNILPCFQACRPCKGLPRWLSSLCIMNILWYIYHYNSNKTMQKFNIIVNVDMTISQTYSLFIFAKKISMVTLKLYVIWDKYSLSINRKKTVKLLRKQHSQIHFKICHENKIYLASLIICKTRCKDNWHLFTKEKIWLTVQDISQTLRRTDAFIFSLKHAAAFVVSSFSLLEHLGTLIAWFLQWMVDWPYLAWLY